MVMLSNDQGNAICQPTGREDVKLMRYWKGERRLYIAINSELAQELELEYHPNGQ